MIMFIFKEDNVFNMMANLPFGPPMNIDNYYYRNIFFGLICDVSCVIYVRRSQCLSFNAEHQAM